jgi:hypothetical protein
MADYEEYPEEYQEYLDYYGESQGGSRTWLIVAIVVVVTLLCCCCLALVASFALFSEDIASVLGAWYATHSLTSGVA